MDAQTDERADLFAVAITVAHWRHYEKPVRLTG